MIFTNESEKTKRSFFSHNGGLAFKIGHHVIPPVLRHLMTVINVDQGGVPVWLAVVLAPRIRE